MLNKKPDRALVETTLYFSSLILNIFLGWLATKLNTAYLDLVEYGRYSFFMIILFFSRTLFSFGLFDSASHLLAVNPAAGERKKLLGTGLIFSAAFSLLFGMFFLLLSVLSDRLFEVKIGGLCFRYAGVVLLILVHSYYVLALRGTGQIKSLSILTVLPRIFYLVLLAIIVFIDRFSLTWSLDMFFMGFGLSLIWCTIIIQPSFKSMRQSVVRLWHDLKLYGIHLYLSNIWNELLFHGDKFIISLFLPAQSLAYYYLAYALTFPLSHFSTALSTTMFNRFALQRRIDSRVLRVNMLFVLSSVGVFIVLRRFIIINLFSPDYLPTVAVMLPLALAFGFSSVSKPFTLFLVARGEGKVVRNISIVIPILNIILGLIIIPHFGIMGAAWTQVLVYCCDLLLYFLAYRKFIANLSA